MTNPVVDAVAQVGEWPKRVATTKLGQGEYRLSREDGYSLIVVKRANGRWSANPGGWEWLRLSSAQFDMAEGHTPHDRIALTRGERT